MDTKIKPTKAFDLTGQKKALNEPGEVYIAKTIKIGRFVADFGSILGYSGDHVGMIWA